MALNLRLEVIKNVITTAIHIFNILLNIIDSIKTEVTNG